MRILNNFHSKFTLKEKRNLKSITNNDLSYFLVGYTSFFEKKQHNNKIDSKSRYKPNQLKLSLNSKSFIQTKYFAIYQDFLFTERKIIKSKKLKGIYYLKQPISFCKWKHNKIKKKEVLHPRNSEFELFFFKFKKKNNFKKLSPQKKSAPKVINYTNLNFLKFSKKTLKLKIFLSENSIVSIETKRSYSSNFLNIKIIAKSSLINKLSVDISTILNIFSGYTNISIFKYSWVNNLVKNYRGFEDALKKNTIYNEKSNKNFKYQKSNFNIYL